MNTVMDIGTQLVQMCREGQYMQATEKLYSKDILSIEAADMGQGRTTEGLDKVLGRTKWWQENNTVHSATVEGPFPFDDKFAVFFKMDVTSKMDNKRMQMNEVAVYWVQNGKITREEFMYKGM